MSPDLWSRITGSQPAPPAPVIVSTAALAVLLVAWPAAWRRARAVVTIAHEGAHGVAALATGRRLAGIRLHSDTSGVTVSSGRRAGPGMVVTAAAGYLGPALLGLGAAGLLHLGRAVALLWVTVALLGLLLLQIRNLYGLWTVLVSGLAVFAVSWWGSGPVQSGFAYAETWFLLLAAPRPVFELHRERRVRRARGTDADQLARLTRIPALAWVGLFLLVALGAVLVGGRWLIAPAV